MQIYQGRFGSNSFAGLKQLSCLDGLSFYACYLPSDHLNIIAHLTRLTQLTINKPKDLFTSYAYDEIRQLSSLRNIRQLNILRSESISKTEEYLKVLSLFPNLESLQHVPLLRENHVELAKHMKSLQSVYIEALHIEDLAFHHLSEMTKLTRLKIIDADTTESNNFIKLSSLKNLRELQLYNCHIDINVLSGGLLERVQLDSMELQSLSWLEKCSQLKILELFYTKVHNYIGIQYLTQLEDLTLCATELTDAALNLIPGKNLTRLVMRNEHALTSNGVGEWTLPSIATNLMDLDIGECGELSNDAIIALFASPFIINKLF
mgnify:CR=1 FL=1